MVFYKNILISNFMKSSFHPYIPLRMNFVPEVFCIVTSIWICKQKSDHWLHHCTNEVHFCSFISCVEKKNSLKVICLCWQPVVSKDREYYERYVIFAQYCHDLENLQIIHGSYGFLLTNANMHLCLFSIWEGIHC